jgi:hypothetical protein
MKPGKKSGSSVSGKTYRLGATVPDRIRLLLDDRRIKEQEFAQADVAAVWQKATASARDASLSGLSVDSAIRLAYDAGHLGALALLAVHGLKSSSGQGHHEIAFHAAAALGGTSLEAREVGDHGGWRRRRPSRSESEGDRAARMPTRSTAPTRVRCSVWSLLTGSSPA